MNRAALIGGIASALLLAAPAFAAAPVGNPAAGLQAMRELNLIVFGDLKQNNQNVEGKTFVGGDLTGGGQYGTGNSARSQAESGRATLSVVGDVSGNDIKLHNGSNGGNGSIGAPAAVAVGGNLASGMNMNAGNAIVNIGGDVRNLNGSAGSAISVGGGRSGYLNANGAKVTTRLGGDYADQLVSGLTAEQEKLQADLNATSLALTGLSTTAGNSITSYYGRMTFNAMDDGSGISVFNITDSIFSAAEFDLKLANPANTVIFNISGDGSYNWNANSLGGMNWTVADNIIWNFADATVLNLNRQMFGSVLATNAVVTNLNQLSGTIVAAEMRQKGQVQLGSFAGNADFGSDGLAGAVPEPATWAMLIAGFGLVGTMLRRRRAVVA